MTSLQVQVEQVIVEVKEDVAGVCRSAGLELAGITLTGTAGTATTLAALELQMTKYDWQRINNYVLPLPRLQYWQRYLAPMSPAAREALPGMEPGRGDLIPAGLEIILCLMRYIHADALTVSDSGLLEGLLLSLQNSGKT
jgi:exopolyphosphatase/guanosine-5'-triphosphate,3'-diphosphate pyrophosphatase